MKKIIILVCVLQVFMFSSCVSADQTNYWFDSNAEIDCADYLKMFSDLEGEYKYGQIIDIANSLVEKGYDYKSYFIFLGRSYYNNKDYMKSIVYFQKSLDSNELCYPPYSASYINRENSAINYIISDAYKKSRTNDKSLLHYNKAVRLYKDVVGENFDENKMEMFFEKAVGELRGLGPKNQK